MQRLDKSKLFVQLQEIRQSFEEAWDNDTAHEKYNGKKGSSTGQCFVSTLVAFVLLKKFKPNIVHGCVEGADDDHFWLEIGRTIIDFTADQFEGGCFLPIIFLPYDDMPLYRADKRYVSIEAFRESSGFNRFELLLSRMNLGDT